MRWNRGIDVDVRCERCGTEYEFDEALLAPAGTPVRCGQCQFAFRVMPLAPLVGGWTVKRDDGIHVHIASLADLRARIRRGELAAPDLIARQGEPWKALGDIAELGSTFDSARTVRKPRPDKPTRPNDLSTTPFARASHPTLQGVPAAPEMTGGRDAARDPGSAPISASAPAERQAAAATWVGPADAPSAAANASPTSASTSPAGTAPLNAPPTVASRPRRGVVESVPPPPRPRAPSSKPRLSLALDDDEVPARGRDSRIGWIGLIVAVLAGLGGTMWFRAATARQADARRSMANAAAAELGSDTYDAYRGACATLAAAHAASPADVVPPTLVARCHARWAQALRDEARFEIDEPRANSLRGLATEHIAEAARFAALAVGIDDTSAAAHLAAADSARLRDDFDASEAELARAAALGERESSEALRLRAELAASRAGDDARAEADAARAAALAPRDARVQALVARAAFALGDRPRLDATLATLRSLSSRHPMLHGIEAALVARDTTADAGAPPERGLR